jgi:hypothetical protein
MVLVFIGELNVLDLWVGQIVNWRNNLKFPEEAKLSPEAKDIISRLLCDVEHRLGTRGVTEIKVGRSCELVAQSSQRK